jgi:LmbE family N-acetylglucosaminyl deacetylase
MASRGLDVGGRALAVGAHPDDAEFGCFGTLQRFEARSVLVLSAGEMGGPPDKRRREAAEAAEAVGAELRVGDEPDTALAVAPAADALTAAVARFRPDVVFCPSAADEHQDHATVARACRLATRGFAGLVLAYLTPSAAARFRPQVFVGLDDAEWEAKLAALDAHRTQSHRSYLSREYLEVTARYWALQGGECLVRAEPFEVMRWVAPGGGVAEWPP